MKKILVLLFLFSPLTAFAATTWNGSDMGANLTLSGGNLVVTRGAGLSGATWESVRSTSTQTAGKWYYEVTVTSGSAASLMAGVANSSALVNAVYIGIDTNGKSYYNGGDFRYNGSGAGTPATYTTADVIGVALDASTGNVTFYKNNVSQGTESSSVTGPYYAGVSLLTNGNVFTANFGAADGTGFTYTPPTGYSGWDQTVFPVGGFGSLSFFGWF